MMSVGIYVHTHSKEYSFIVNTAHNKYKLVITQDGMLSNLQFYSICMPLNSNVYKSSNKSSNNSWQSVENAVRKQVCTNAH